MQIKPIIAALRHHKAGTLLIALQIALTLAIVCNALFIIHLRMAHMAQTSGVDEANLLVIQNGWVGKPAAGENASMLAADLATLRKVPGVVDVYATNAWPLAEGGTVYGIGHTPDKLALVTSTAVYFVDDHALATLGLKLVAGRNFHADEISATGPDHVAPAEVIVTRALAERMFPDGSALGKMVYVSAKPSVIVGVVERMQAPWVDNFAAKWADYATLVPYQLMDSAGANYMVRAVPGQRDDVVRAAPKALLAANPMRVINRDNGVQTYADIRADAYKSDRGMAILMSVISVMLLAITAAGIVGLTSFWVGQRRKQIGVRRALGATRGDILRYFLTENLLIGIGGVLIGIVMAVTVNLWVVTQFEMARLSLGYVIVGTAVLLVLGQCAVLAPALRASKVPPVEATRSV
ncbi:FtsX-like permease family protein [Rhodanobacter sp. L36]|uniref:ABC transporter permease n=1 Tax=Rhodanobacter sp. L36 TaxID=1747221 RepID=UPI00131CEE70|nr:FtsX-like permease family protein [Rhodanobacter sp. L36]